METFSPLPQSHFCNIDPSLKAGYQVWNIGEFRWKRYFSSKIRILKVLCQGWPVSNLLPSAPGPCNSFTLFKTQKKKEKKLKIRAFQNKGCNVVLQSWFLVRGMERQVQDFGWHMLETKAFWWASVTPSTVCHLSKSQILLVLPQVG